MKHRFTLGGFSHSVSELFWSGIFEEIRQGPSPDSRKDVLVLMVGSKHNNLRSRTGLLNLPRGLYAVHAYLHDGRATSLAEVFTLHNPADRHGVTSTLSEEQIEDLVVFLLSLPAGS